MRGRVPFQCDCLTKDLRIIVIEPVDWIRDPQCVKMEISWSGSHKWTVPLFEVLPNCTVNATALSGEYYGLY